MVGPGGYRSPGRVLPDGGRTRIRDQNEQTIAAPAQPVGAALVVVVLVIAAFAIPRRSGPEPGPVPPWWLAGCCTLFAAYQMAPSTWTGVALDVVLLGTIGGLLLFWSGRHRWGQKLAVLVCAYLQVRRTDVPGG